MIRATARQTLALAAVLCLSLSIGVIVYHFAALLPDQRPRRVHPLFTVVPVLVPLAVVQFIRFDSWGRRLFVSLVVAGAATLGLVLVAFLLACGLFNGCS